LAGKFYLGTDLASFVLEIEMDIQTFQPPFVESLEIRTIIEGGEPFFVASDVAHNLGYRMASDMTRRLDQEDRGTRSVRTPSGEQDMTVITESGLYEAIMGSQIAAAKDFKRWVTREVLPQIRKTGAYHSVPQTFAEALQLAADQARTIETQALQIESAKPAVAFMDEYVEAKSTKDISTVGKTLGMAPKEFFAKLSDMGVMFKRGGDWLPYQEHLDAGRFEVKTGTKHGHTWHQARFTPKGVAWIARHIA